MRDFFPAMDGSGGPWTQIIASGPDDDRAAIHRFYFNAIAGARERVWLTTPYFVPDEVDPRQEHVTKSATAPTANTTTTVTNPTMVLSADAVATRLGGGG